MTRFGIRDGLRAITAAFLLTAALPSLANEAAIREAIRSINPVAKIDSIKPGPIRGLVEVRAAGAVVYVSDDGRRVFAGDVYDVAARQNITEASRQEVRADILKGIDPASRIRYGKADAKHTLYVFTDISCPYCTRLHEDMDELNRLGVAIEYLAYPRAGIQSEPGQVMNGAWCAPNRQTGLDAAFAGKAAPGKGCSQVLRRHVEAARLLEVEGTPTIYTKDGRQLGGYLPPAELLEAIGG